MLPGEELVRGSNTVLPGEEVVRGSNTVLPGEEVVRDLTQMTQDDGRALSLRHEHGTSVTSSPL